MFGTKPSLLGQRAFTVMFLLQVMPCVNMLSFPRIDLHFHVELKFSLKYDSGGNANKEHWHFVGLLLACV